MWPFPSIVPHIRNKRKEYIYSINSYIGFYVFAYKDKTDKTDKSQKSLMFPDECIVTQNSLHSDKRDKTHFTISAAYTEQENVKSEYMGWDQKKIPG